MIPVIEGQFVFPGFTFAEDGPSLMCRWCDAAVAWFTWDDEQMWAELEMLERGSWPRRIQDLLPQVDPPTELT